MGLDVFGCPNIIICLLKGHIGLVQNAEELAKLTRKEELINLIKERALSFGKFILTSGKESNYYIDFSKVLFTAKGTKLVAEGILESVVWGRVDSIGGPAIGAVGIVSSVLGLLENSGWEKRGFFVRKESKSHGKEDLVEGNLEPEDRVVLVEDVTTTGHSLLKTVDEVRRRGCVIKSVVSVLDRQQGAVELFKSKSIPFISLIKVSEVL